MLYEVITKLDLVDSLKLSTNEIKLFRNDHGVITLEVKLLNEAGQVVKSDFSTMVSLVAGNEFLSNFKVSALQQKSEGGIVKFYITPKTSISGKNFSFSVKVKNSLV